MRIEHAGRHNAQSDIDIADLDLVPGIVAAAETRHHVVVLRVQIDDAPFSFVTPLDADDDVRFSHARTRDSLLREPLAWRSDHGVSEAHPTTLPSSTATNTGCRSSCDCNHSVRSSTLFGSVSNVAVV